MRVWLVLPIVIPIFVVLMVVAFVSYRALWDQSFCKGTRAWTFH